MDPQKEFMTEVGDVVLKAIVYEAKKDFAKSGAPGNAGGSKKTIFDTFKVKVVGTNSLQIVSDWPGIEQMTGQGSKAAKDETPGAYPMTWLTQANPRLKGKPIPIVTKKGLIFRMAPLAGEGFWIHPGIQKYGFVQKGIKRAIRQLVEGGKLAEIYMRAVSRIAGEGAKK